MFCVNLRCQVGISCHFNCELFAFELLDFFKQLLCISWCQLLLQKLADKQAAFFLKIWFCDQLMVGVGRQHYVNGWIVCVAMLLSVARSIWPDVSPRLLFSNTPRFSDGICSYSFCFLHISSPLFLLFILVAVIYTELIVTICKCKAFLWNMKILKAKKMYFVAFFCRKW